MAKLSSTNSRKVVKAFETLGWQVVRSRGSHIIMAVLAGLMKTAVGSAN
jgi:predicted RNA binding protein YcfA (HicA-like mRNA interferase family)